MPAHDKEGRLVEVGNIVVIAARVTRVGEGSIRNIEVQPVDLPEGEDPRDHAFTVHSTGVTRA